MMEDVQEMSLALERMEATMSVVQLMYREDSIETIMSDFLEMTGSYLGISCAGIYQLHPMESQVELIAGWKADVEEEGLSSVLDADKNIIKKLDQPIFVSTGGMKKEPDMSIGIDVSKIGSDKAAFSVLPVMIHDAGDMYACFVENRAEKSWTPEEMHYLKETVRILHSVVMRRIRKNSLASSYLTLGNILDNIGCGIYVKDMDSGRLEFVNTYIRNTFAAELKEGILDKIFEGKEDLSAEGGSYEVYYRDRNTWYDFYYTTITWVNGKIVRLCSLYDISDKKIYQHKIEQQAYTDFLTGLYNRMCCNRDMAEYIALTKKNGTKGALLYLDLDNFKSVNDNLGHQYGDLLLQKIADGMRSISGLSESCYRMGGDEFVIIIPPDYYNKRTAIMEQMGALFHTPFQLNDVSYQCTMSMGIVTFPDNGESVDELIKKADNTMYIAKKGGKDRIVEYSKE